MKYALLYKDHYYSDAYGEQYKTEYETLVKFDTQQAMLDFLRWKDPSKTFTPIEYEELTVATRLEVVRPT